MSVDPTNGTIPAGGSAQITVKYDVSQNEFQGVYSADILLTTNAQPLAKVKSHRPYSKPPAMGFCGEARALKPVLLSLMSPMLRSRPLLCCLGPGTCLDYKYLETRAIAFSHLFLLHAVELDNVLQNTGSPSADCCD